MTMIKPPKLSLNEALGDVSKSDQHAPTLSVQTTVANIYELLHRFHPPMLIEHSQVLRTSSQSK